MARDASIPKCGPRQKHKYSPFWNSACSEAKRLRKLAEKTLRKECSLENQINFKKAKSFFQRIFRNAKQIYWENFCTNLSYKTKNSNVWKTIKKLKYKKWPKIN